MEVSENTVQYRQAQCCIVGGGPAGVMTAYLLARKGVEVILLERAFNFDRDFRGDTIHPSTLKILSQLGLIDAFLQLPHSRHWFSLIVGLKTLPDKGLTEKTKLKEFFPS